MFLIGFFNTVFSQVTINSGNLVWNQPSDLPLNIGGGLVVETGAVLTINTPITFNFASTGIFVKGPNSKIIINNTKIKFNSGKFKVFGEAAAELNTAEIEGSSSGSTLEIYNASLSNTSSLVMNGNSKIHKFIRINLNKKSLFTMNFTSHIILNTGRIDIKGGTMYMKENSKIELKSFIRPTYSVVSSIRLLKEDSIDSKCVINGSMGVANVKLDFQQESYIEIQQGIMEITNAEFTMGEDSEIFIHSNYIYNNNIILNYPNFIQLNNTLFKGSVNGTSWNGIKIYGKGLSSQYKTKPIYHEDDLKCPTSQWKGVLSDYINRIYINDCIIKDAKIGIHVVSPTTYSLNSHPEEIFTPKSNGGAVARIRNSHFVNCETGVKIAEYANADGIHGSYVMNSTFTWDDNINANFNYADLKHIFLDRLYRNKVNIGGCTFKNEITTQQATINRGIGINAYHTDFNISKDGDKCCPAVEGEGTCPDNCYNDSNKTPKRNNFDRLGYGIKYEGGTKATSPVFTAKELAIRFSDFTNCMFGIEADLVKEGMIGENTFNTTKTNMDALFTSSIDIPTNLKYTASYGMRIYENKFTNNGNDKIKCILSENPPANKLSIIKTNKFYCVNTDIYTNQAGLEVRAIDLLGNHNHLDIECNEFYTFMVDIYVNGIIGRIPYAQDKEAKNLHSVLTPTSLISGNYYESLTDATNIYITNPSLDVYTIEPMYITTSILSNINYNAPTKPSSCIVSCQDLVDMKVGIKKIKAFNYFSIYPNPAHSSIRVKLKYAYMGQNTTLKIVDIQGKLIHEQLIIGTEDEIRINASPGIYFVKIQNNKFNQSQKLIIQ